MIPWRKVFSCFSTIVMLSVTFQIFADSECSAEAEVDIGDPPGRTPAHDVNITEPLRPLPLPETPVYDSASAGLESYPASNTVLSGLDGSPGGSHLSVEGRNVTIWTQYGSYSIDSDNPAFLSFVSRNNTILVCESYFLLKSDELISTPVNGTIISVGDDCLVTEYDLVAGSGRQVGRMQITTDFECGRPKITAKVLAVNELLNEWGNWQVVWRVAVPQGSALSSETQLPRLLSTMEGFDLSIPGYGVEIRPSGSGPDAAVLEVNWSDAADGTLSVASDNISSGGAADVVQVTFSKWKAEIDPTLVTTTNSTSPTEMSFQRKVFWRSGYYWAFYDRGDIICYKTSPDGLSWSGEMALPEGTALKQNSGFDVAERDGWVGIVWINSAQTYIYFKSGLITGSKIIWNGRDMLEGIRYSNYCTAPASVVAGSDGFFYVFTQAHFLNGYGYLFNVKRILYGNGLIEDISPPDSERQRYGNPSWDAMATFGMGNLVLVETVSWSTTARVRYWSSSSGEWTNPVEHDIGVWSGATMADKWSIVAYDDGTVNVAYKENSLGRLWYASIKPDGTMLHYSIAADNSVRFPSICLDTNGDTHVYYLAPVSSKWAVKHTQKLGPQQQVWTSPDVLYAETTFDYLEGLTSWQAPIGAHAMLWTKDDSQVVFACIPMPYGTLGAQSDPWNRDGISPYGVYFSTHGQNVAPGSGLLTMTEEDISIPSRAGLELGVTRLYMEPRYFRLNGTPYGATGYPFCNLGQGWSLDLPWMDENFIGISGGQRFIIQWGNDGVYEEYENHEGTRFMLRDVTKSGLHGPIEFYELTMASGLRFVFNHESYTLEEMSDLEGYDFDSGQYTDSLNAIWFVYDYSNNRLSAIEEGDLERTISFTYDDDGNLWKITRPDSATTTFGYTVLGNKYLLTSVIDPDNRTTTYNYSSSWNCSLDKVTFPSGGSISYTFLPDPSAGTEVRSYLVTSAKVEGGSSGALVSQTNFSYKISGGRMLFTRQTDTNETGAVQGYTEYIFQSALQYTSETKRDSASVQMGRSETWYDSLGQPVRVDTFLGDSLSPAYSEYTGYDNWGNVILAKDALGHEEYYSYENTDKQNSFQGGGVLERTSQGKLFYDSFDDWDFSDWYTCTSAGTIILDGTSDPPNAPGIKLERTDAYGSWNLFMYHYFASQISSFVVQYSFITNASSLDDEALVYLSAGGSDRLCLRAYNGQFDYWTGSTFATFGATYSVNVSYEIGLVIHANSTYDIYIDGSKKKTGAQLYSSGEINVIKLYMYGQVGSSMCIDNICVYKSLVVTINGMSGYVAELYDSRGSLLDRNRSGTLTIPAPQLFSPPAVIKMCKVGYSSFETAVMDVWGGDAYNLSTGLTSMALTKNETGFGHSLASVADDSWPDGATVYTNNDVAWVADSDYSVSGSSYRQSNHRWGTHWHGFDRQGYPVMTTTSTDMLVQYVWLSEGKIPQEIALQFRINDLWKRVYWGESDMLSDPSLPSPTSTFRAGDVPQATGKWLQLTVRSVDIGYGYVSGCLYALYGGTAKWDLTCKAKQEMSIYGLSQGTDVELRLDDGNVIYGTAGASAPLNLDLISTAHERAYPLSGSFTIYNADSALLYESPVISEIYNGDHFTFSAPEFYPNEVKKPIHDRLVGSLQCAGATQQKSFSRYDEEGNRVETKGSIDSDWVRTQAAYDQYGNMIWKIDETGRSIVKQYSDDDWFTYPVAIGSGGCMDTYDVDTSWRLSKSSSGGSTEWLTASYSGSRSMSSPNSMKLSFAAATSNAGTGLAWKSYDIATPIVNMSVSRYLESYSHDTLGKMDSGIRMLLYDSSGTNFGIYSYLLACWSDGYNNWTEWDNTTTKVIYGNSSQGEWARPVVHPSEDFPGINWSRCANITFELYFNVTGAGEDALTIYYDDLMFDDFSVDSDSMYTCDSDNGWQLSQTDALGQTTNFSYDVLGRTIWTEYADGSYIRFVYEDSNNSVASYDEQDHVTVKHFDSLGRLVLEERYGSGSTVYSDTHVSFDWRDQVRNQTDELGGITAYTYDYLGRQTMVVNPDGTFRTATYDDENITVLSEDELGHKKAQVFDELGRLVETREYNSTIHCYVTRMTYDDVGNLIEVADDIGSSTLMTYDDLNRHIGTEYPDGFEEFVSYDETGRVLIKTDRADVSTASTYDTAGNLIRISNPSDTVRYSYDAAGQKTEASNTLGNITCAYDLRGRLVSQTEVIGGHSYSVFFGYDIGGRQIWICYPNGANVSFSYDSYDRPTNAVRTNPSPNTTLWSAESYNVDDTIYQETAATGHKTTYAYDDMGRPISISTLYGKMHNLTLDYWYDAVGNVEYLSQTGKFNSDENYSYDALDRMTYASGNWGTIFYRYDEVGNRLSMTRNSSSTTNYTYIPGEYNKLNRTQQGGTPVYYNYSKLGDLRWKNGTSVKWNYVFNGMGQLTQVNKWTKSGSSWYSEVKARYYYDANAARAKTVDFSTYPATTTEYVYLGHDPIYERVNRSGTPTTCSDYLYVNGALKAQLEGSSGAYTHVHLNDALGGTRQIFNGTALIFSVHAYMPFGAPWLASSYLAHVVTFAGEIRDNTGLYYLFARYMDPELGRSISIDPQMGRLSDPQSLNRYVYCVNNPLRFTDPTGEWFGISLKTTLKFACIIGGIALAAGLTFFTAGTAMPLLYLAIGQGLICGGASGLSTYAETGSLQESLFSFGIGFAFGAATEGGSMYFMPKYAQWGLRYSVDDALRFAAEEDMTPAMRALYMDHVYSWIERQTVMKGALAGTSALTDYSGHSFSHSMASRIGERRSQQDAFLTIQSEYIGGSTVHAKHYSPAFLEMLSKQMIECQYADTGY